MTNEAVLYVVCGVVLIAAILKGVPFRLSGGDWGADFGSKTPRKPTK